MWLGRGWMDGLTVALTGTDIRWCVSGRLSPATNPALKCQPQIPIGVQVDQYTFYLSVEILRMKGVLLLPR